MEMEGRGRRAGAGAAALRPLLLCPHRGETGKFLTLFSHSRVR